MLIVFTGNGKGKTTAAIGQAIRALGHNKRVLVIQFIKGPWKSGEHEFAEKIPVGLRKKFQIIKTGKGFVGILGDKFPISEHKKAAQSSLKLAEKEIKSGKWDLVILDEINVAVGLRLINVGEVLKILENRQRKSASMDVILTGRDAPESFIKVADLATEMKEIKHPFQKGKAAKAAVEF